MTEHIYLYIYIYIIRIYILLYINILLCVRCNFTDLVPIYLQLRGRHNIILPTIATGTILQVNFN